MAKGNNINVLVSICVPIFGVEKYIERCAKSLFAQTYENIEYIFVDDCSRDKSVDILLNIIDENPDKLVKIIRHKNNRGLAAARNTAIEAAHGEFIMHVDSDDWIENNAVELLIHMQHETGADIVSGLAMCHTNEGDWILCEPGYNSGIEMAKQMVEIELYHTIWRRVIRRSLYIDNNIRAIEGRNIGEDHYTLPRLAWFANQVAKVNQVIYHYNCLNSESYMRKEDVNRHFNFSKYTSDKFALDYLSSFFIDKDAAIAERIKEINVRFCIYWKTLAVKCRDWNAYRIVCDDDSTVHAKPRYFYYVVDSIREVYNRANRLIARMNKAL